MFDATSTTTTSTTTFLARGVDVQIVAAPIPVGKKEDKEENEATTVEEKVLTRDALRFVGTLCATFEDRRQAILQARQVRLKERDAGVPFTFAAAPILSDDDKNEEDWTCADIPEEVLDRRVEITGPPVDRKMLINGLNSGANVYMADLEDSTSPTWQNMIRSQAHLIEAVRGDIVHVDPNTGKTYRLNAPDDSGNAKMIHPMNNNNKNSSPPPPPKLATLFVRPRGWHLDEAHVRVNGRPASASIFDFALYLFHNHAVLACSSSSSSSNHHGNYKGRPSRPYFYLPKLEDASEAQLWNDVFCAAQAYLGLPVGTIRATVLLETLPAAFQMDAILYALRDHSLGLNCGRWDYLFSFIKQFRNHAHMLTPDRAYLTMRAPLMTAYVQRLVRICHARQTFAMGGMSAVIPVRNHALQNNETALQAVRDDKEREVQLGHDGTWVAHPALVPVARAVFDAHLGARPNQIVRPHHHTSTNPDHDHHEAQQLLQLPTTPHCPPVTSSDVQKGIAIVLAYTEAYLRGVGCIPLDGKMEDAATAEISRAQIWTWRVHQLCTRDAAPNPNHNKKNANAPHDNSNNKETTVVVLPITSERITSLIQEYVHDQLHKTNQSSTSNHHHNNKWQLAGQLVTDMLTKDTLDDFLTSVCYPYIVTPPLHHHNPLPAKSRNSKL